MNLHRAMRLVLTNKYFEYFQNNLSDLSEIRADMSILSLSHIYEPTKKEIRVCIIGPLHVQSILMALLSSINNEVWVFTENLSESEMKSFHLLQNIFHDRIIAVISGNIF